ncbi:MAG TPA: diguanylate cyclase, partial [Burkholderiales bacterium]|nr:diguanylate cyclase [Burkholderiales bacterium]
MTRSGEAMEQTGTLGPGRAVNQHATPELLVDDADQPATASKATAKIMLVDEEELNIEILQAFLQEVGYANFVSTSEPREAIDLMTNERPDVVLLDLGQSQVCAFDIVSRMQQDSVLKHVPVIMLTAAADASTKLAALKLGVTDFLAKPVDPSELLLRLRNTLTAKAYLDQLAYCDTLTGLANRERFHDRLDWTIRFSRRYGTTGAVLQIGLDRFMQVNDALGPGVGDRLLRAVAMRLERSLRDSDVLAHTASDATSTVLSRIGGDEFTVLLPALATVAGAGEVAQRVLDIVAAPFNIAGIELFVTCCVGIALFPADGTARDTVLKAASIAMRHAKSEGRNRFRFFSKTLNARSLHRLSLEGQLRKALERDELELFYQPKVELESARLVGAEALVRWRHPERGLVSPGEFIALAEESGLIIPLGSWVLRAACSQIREWRDAGHKLPRISVNVSSHQFKQR